MKNGLRYFTNNPFGGADGQYYLRTFGYVPWKKSELTQLSRPVFEKTKCKTFQCRNYVVLELLTDAENVEIIGNSSGYDTEGKIRDKEQVKLSMKKIEGTFLWKTVLIFNSPGILNIKFKNTDADLYPSDGSLQSFAYDGLVTEIVKQVFDSPLICSRT